MSQTLALNPKMSGWVEKHGPTTLLTSPVAGEKLDEPELAMRTGSFLSCFPLPPSNLAAPSLPLFFVRAG